MVIFIYNLVSIAFSLMLVYTNHIEYATLFYVAMSLCATVITYFTNVGIKSYKNINDPNKEAVIKIVYVDGHETRLANFIGSFVVHSSIVLMLMHSTLLFILISLVFIYRVLSLIKNNKFILKQGKSL